MIGKLQVHSRQNLLTRALQEYGRLIQTIFLLRYLESEDYRRRINTQLNKGEALHALREFLFFANRGTLRRKQEDAQTNQAGCLHLLTNAVVVWNTVYMAAAIEQLRVEGYPVQDEDIVHLAPARYEHINPYGAPRNARKESFYEETLLGVDSVARGTCNRTRGRGLWEAPSTMWRTGRLRPRALLARVWLRLRKKLPTEASHDGPPVDGRPRVELSERWSRIDERNFIRVGSQYFVYTLRAPVTSKATSRARRTGRTYDHMVTLSV